MMPEYTENNDCIRRSAAMDLVDLYWQQAYNAHFSDAALRLGSLYLDMEDIPAADVRSVVTCGECIHRHDPRRQMCAGRRPDFFCADGEKREES